MHNSSKTLIFVLGLITILSSLPYARLDPVEVNASIGYRVHNLNTGLNYTTIQEAINASQTSSGHTILADEGTYYEHVSVTKSITLLGQNRSTTVIDGSTTGTVIHVTANSVTIKGFTVQNGSIGIHVDHSDNSVVRENNVIDTIDDGETDDSDGGILISYSGYCGVYDNLARNNAKRGIFVTNSHNFVVSDNIVYGPQKHYGLNANASTDGLITRNNAYVNSFDGIGLLNSSYCIVAANNVSNNNMYGIYVEDSYHNAIYHNNIVNNLIQALDENPTNQWDDGVEGNYWSDYVGVDLHSGPYRNETGSDGIGDFPQAVGAYSTDQYPLMSRLRSFKTPYDYQVNVVSNSTISHFNFNLINSTHAALNFNVSEVTGSDGFCRIRIPKYLINGSYIILFDGTNITEPQVRELSCSNETYEYLYICYTHSDHSIEVSGTTVIPEFPQATIVLMLVIITLLAVMLARRKHIA